MENFNIKDIKRPFSFIESKIDDFNKKVIELQKPSEIEFKLLYKRAKPAEVSK